MTASRRVLIACLVLVPFAVPIRAQDAPAATSAPVTLTAEEMETFLKTARTPSERWPLQTAQEEAAAAQKRKPDPN